MIELIISINIMTIELIILIFHARCI